MIIYLIKASTGCSCCNEENHIRGPYKTLGAAKKRIEYYKSEKSKFWPLASQYASRGCYTIYEIEAEEISKGRYIIDDKVFEAADMLMVEVRWDGSVEDNKKEYFTHDYIEGKRIE